MVYQAAVKDDAPFLIRKVSQSQGEFLSITVFYDIGTDPVFFLRNTFPDPGHKDIIKILKRQGTAFDDKGKHSPVY